MDLIQYTNILHSPLGTNRKSFYALHENKNLAIQATFKHFCEY
jgi:hypothetical protein